MAAAAKKAASSASAKKGDDLKVVAPLVQVQIGDRVLHLYQGDIVPEGISKESLDHLSELGYVTKGDQPDTSDDE